VIRMNDKETILNDFNRWIDEAMASGGNLSPFQDGENSPTGKPDLFTLLAEMTALKDEVHRHARHVRTSIEEFSAVSEDIRELHEEISDTFSNNQEAAVYGAETLMDLFDRLHFTIETAHKQLASRVFFWNRRWAKQFASFVQGLELTREFILSELHRNGIEWIDSSGKPFDATLMRAIGTRTSDTAEGTILAVSRNGFRCGEKVLRFAEVIVAKSEGINIPEK
jgi:molecular chaperone GrpE